MNPEAAAPAPPARSPVFRRAATLLLLVVAVVAVRVSLKPYQVPVDAMEESILPGDSILVNRLAYRFGDPGRGDVVVFRYPPDPAKEFIGRVVALGGETVELRDKKLLVDGKEQLYPREVHREKEIVPLEQNPRDNLAPVKVAAGSYFVMGDNRDRAWDSRFWGGVPRGDITGKAAIIYWSRSPENGATRWGRVGAAVR